MSTARVGFRPFIIVLHVMQRLSLWILLQLTTILLLLVVPGAVQSFCCFTTTTSITKRISSTHLCTIHRHSDTNNAGENHRPLARLVVREDHGHKNDDACLTALEHAGFDVIVISPTNNIHQPQPVAKNIDDDDHDHATKRMTTDIVDYRYNIATGMLQLVSSSPYKNKYGNDGSFPRWVPLVQPQETVLIQNGWSFLDVDESEKVSPFDVDAANLEGSYQPQWKTKTSASSSSSESDDTWNLSELGFDLTPYSEQQVVDYATTRLKSSLARRVLLEGATDPPGLKQTHNYEMLSGSVTHVEPGIFTSAISGLPVFATSDLSPWTASSGWLSFARPISPDHIVLVEPKPGSNDRRVEVLCAKSKCHLGHYFGPGEGYCINASVLNYFRSGVHHHDDHSDHINGEKDALLFSCMAPPISYRSLEQQQDSSPSVRILNEVLRAAMSEFEIAPAPTTSITRRYSKASYVCEVVLGAGCFWHVEAALRRLPGVVDTTVGYAGGGREPFSPALTYEQVCQGATGHAEVVRVKFHPSILTPRVLLDCFLAMHDPTKVRAHGKHAHGTGQYRSCILVEGTASLQRDEKEEEETLVGTTHQALMDCRAQLGNELSTELCVLNTPMDDWFFAAEERHQRHDEQKQKPIHALFKNNNLSTLPLDKWLEVYGTRRRRSIVGSAQTR